MSSIAQNLIGLGIIGAFLYLIVRMIAHKNPKFKDFLESKKPKSLPIKNPMEVKEQIWPENRATI